MALLLPAWNPDDQLIATLRGVEDFGFGAILLVDDGSVASGLRYFLQARAFANVRVLRHESNQGKGCALKTGMVAFLQARPELHAVVTADADGQHTPEDILRVAECLVGTEIRFVLGARTSVNANTALPRTEVPLRSALGNGLTRSLFRLLYGVRLLDTQTGLRGFARDVVPELLLVPGERYEYETAALVQLCRRGLEPLQVPISTVYLEGNRRSHFRPFADSLRVYRALLRPFLHRGARPGAMRTEVSRVG